MQIQLDSQPYASIHADALVTYVFDQDNKFEGVLADIDEEMDGRLAALASSGELTGKALELVLSISPKGSMPKRLLLVGAGKPGNFQFRICARLPERLASSEIARREEIRRFSRAKASADRRPRRPSSKA